MKFLDKYATKFNIVLGLVFIVFVNLIAFPLFPIIVMGTPFPLESLLDVKFGFSSIFAYNVIANLSEEARHVYLLSTMIIDNIYAVFYGFIFALIVLKLITTNNLLRYKVVVFIPFVISFFDLIENAGIIMMLSSFPIKLELICEITSIANMIKWIFAVILLFVIVANLLILVKSKLMKKF